MGVLAYIRSHAVALPPLAKFALGMALIFGIPPLSRRVRLPAVVGLLLSGVVVGPHVLDIFGEQKASGGFPGGPWESCWRCLLPVSRSTWPICEQAQRRSIIFGLSTSSIPLLLGTAVGLLFGYGLITAIVVGALLASHTLLGSRIVAEAWRASTRAGHSHHRRDASLRHAVSGRVRHVCVDV